MAKKTQNSTKKETKKKTQVTQSNTKPKPIKKVQSVKRNTMLLATERDIATDLATKVYKEFDTMIKSVVLFGSSVKEESTERSDIDIILLLDDISIKFDEELIAWYRKRLELILAKNKYQKPLHISSVKLSTWWNDLLRGDPVVLNVLRNGEPIIDFGGFFAPLRLLLKEGKIRATPESIYTLLERVPSHFSRARNAMLSVVDGIHWGMVDASHAVLISADIMPASPEEITKVLEEHFVKNKLLDKKYIKYYDLIHTVSKDITHGVKTNIEGKMLDELFIIADEYLKEMARLVKDLVNARK